MSKSCLANQSLNESIKKCLVLLDEIRRGYDQRLESLTSSLDAAENTGNKFVVRAIKHRILSFKNTFELGYLAENNFLPSAGIPTGLVEFDNVCKENGGQKCRKMPMQHLSRAITMYAPGKQVVINEWCYQSSGVALKSKFDEAKRDIIQNCARCGYSQLVLGSPLKKCPKCDGHMVGLKGMGKSFTESVEPAGFSVDWLGSRKPTRIVRNNNIMCLTQPLLMQMDPWSEQALKDKIAMRTSTKNSEILFYNSGASQTGFMLCPYCGRMESESADNIFFEKFIAHKHLLTGGPCEACRKQWCKNSSSCCFGRSLSNGFCRS